MNTKDLKDFQVATSMRLISRLNSNGSVLIVSQVLALATIICRVNDFPLGEAFNHIPENAIPTWVEWKEAPQQD